MNRIRPLTLPCWLLVALLARAGGAATFTVMNIGNAGPGSLRQAIVDANGTASSPRNIVFDIPGTGPFTIALTSALPTLTKDIDIDASGEALAGKPGVRLDGSAVPGGNGIEMGSTAGGSSIAYLAITGFPGRGVAIDAGSDNDKVAHCYIGVALDGHTAAGNFYAGILVEGDQAHIGNSILDGNVISANGGNGIAVSGEGAIIRGNYIGTTASGLAALPNAGAGIGGGGAGGVVGGASSLFALGNVISGNTSEGIFLNLGASGWNIAGNLIGVDAAGTAALGNGASGIAVFADGAVIGSTSAYGRNVIAANAQQGIFIAAAADSTEVYGNRIGTNGAGTVGLGAQPTGLRVYGTNCTIGGTDASHRNLISGHSYVGIATESASSGCSISGNYIGLDAAGTTALPNGGGVMLAGSTNTLGGSAAGAGNVISGNTTNGVTLYGVANLILRNFIGTDAAGAVAVPNGSAGIRAIGVSSGTIGGPSGLGNLISGNANAGITLDGDTSNLVIQGNRVGVDAAGSAALPNIGGIVLAGANHLVGSAGAGGNVVSGNTQTGIAVNGSGHVIKGNFVGTDALDNAAIGNGGAGIRVLAASAVTIGGTGAGEGNVISHNGSNGISFDGTSSGCTVLGNRIGTNAAGTAALGNAWSGIAVGGSGHVIGGATAAARNLVSGNGGGGLFLTGSGHLVAGNWIGLNGAGTGAVGNGSYGIRADGIHDVTIGGLDAAAGNVIAGNVRGVNLGYGAYANALLNNVIGLTATATADLPDTGSALEIAGGSHDNQIGVTGAGNVIAGSSYHGIVLTGAATTHNLIQGNFIGTNKALAGGLGNWQVGIFVVGAMGNEIGGAGQGNVIAHNNFIGIWVSQGERNEISANSIFDNGLLGIDVGAQGVQKNDGGDGDVGGNRAQNYPLLSSVVVNGGSTQVDGLLLNEPETQYRVELFSSPECDGTGFGEGKTYLGSTMVTTGPAGQATLCTTLPLAVVDPFVSATVTDGLGNTSEFSPCAEVGGANAGRLQFYRSVTLAYEGVLPTGDVVITRSHGLAGTVTVDFTVSDDTATAGADYTDSDQTVTFAPWEVVKTMKVPILLDPAPEVPNPEQALLHLDNPTNDADLGLADAGLLIFDYDPAYPGVTIDDAAVVEGNAGQKMVSFAVHMTSSDHDVTLGYFTEDGTAVQGEDYEYTEGELAFPVGGPEVQLIQVPIFGDADIEGDETFTMRLTVAPAGGVWIAYDALATGTIVEDDDPEGSGPLFVDAFEIGSTVLWSETETP